MLLKLLGLEYKYVIVDSSLKLMNDVQCTVITGTLQYNTSR